MRITKIPCLTQTWLLTVCISVCAAFTLRDQGIDKRDVDSDGGSIVGRERRSERTQNNLELILDKGKRLEETVADIRLKEILRGLRKSEGRENVLKLKHLSKHKKHVENNVIKRLRSEDKVEIFSGLRRKKLEHNHRGHYLRRLRRSEGKLDNQRSRVEGSEDTDRSRQQVDGQIGRRLITSVTGRVDSTFDAAVLGTESVNRKSAHSHLSPSQQVNNREVNPKHSQHGSSAYRLLHQRRLEGSRLLPKKLDVEIIPKKLEESESFRNLENRRVTRDEGNNVGRSEALAQEVSKVSDHPSTVPKMVVVATTTVAALFGMCVMAAIFQCCCRRKRAASDSEPVDGVKSATSDKKSSKSPSPEKDINKQDGDAEKTENDKLLEDEDLGDFSAVQRETEILKSFRKPPPPKNRARASRVPRMKAAASSEDGFSLIKEEAEGSVKSKSGSRRTSPEKKETTEVKSDEAASPETITKEENISSLETPTVLIETPKVEDKRLSYEAAKQMVDSMLAEVREKGETTLMAKGETTQIQSEQEEKVKEKETANVNGVSAMEGNIFMQIDPTVKIEDPSERKASRIPVKATPPSPSSNPKQEASLRPTSANKDQRKFLVPSVHGEQMDQLVKSLKTKLKEDKGQTCLSDRNLATSKPLNPGSEDSLEPVERERSHSDPTKKLLGVKATHV